MPNAFLNWLETGAQFPLSASEFAKIPEKVKSLLEQGRFLVPVNKEYVNCDKCPELCSLPIEYTEEQPAFYCPTGYLQGIQWLADEDIKGIHIEWEMLFQLIRNNANAEAVKDTSSIKWPVIGYVSAYNAHLILVYKTFSHFEEYVLAIKAMLGSDSLGIITVRKVINKRLRKTLIASGFVTSEAKSD